MVTVHTENTTVCNAYEMVDPGDRGERRPVETVVSIWDRKMKQSGKNQQKWRAGQRLTKEVKYNASRTQEQFV